MHLNKEVTQRSNLSSKYVNLTLVLNLESCIFFIVFNTCKVRLILPYCLIILSQPLNNIKNLF